MTRPAQSGDDSQEAHGGPAWNAQLIAVCRDAAEELADLIELRKAADNRVRSGHYLDSQQARPDWIITAEKAARDALDNLVKKAVPAPVREFLDGTLCLGLTGYRIIGMTGDPCWAVPLLPIAKGDTGRGARSRPSGEPYLRSPHQFWQWCGCGDPDRGDPASQSALLRAGKRRQIRPLLYTWSVQLAKSPSKEKSPYWKVYAGRRLVTTGHEGTACAKDGRACLETHRVHERQCQNHMKAPGSNGCGTSQHPQWGAPGSPWRPGHVQMDGYRVMQKAFLMDLWRVAYQFHPDTSHPETAARRERRGSTRQP